jgi:monoamine oxidase
MLRSFQTIIPALSRDIRLANQSEQELQRFNRMSLAEWLAQSGGDARVTAWITLYMTAVYGLDPAEVSTLNLFDEFGFDPDISAEDFLDDGTADSYFVRGGNDQIARRMAARLHDRVHLGHHLVALAGDASTGYTLTFDKDGSGTADVHADAVVIAIPYSTLRKVDLRVPIDDEQRRIITELGHGNVAKLVLPTRDQAWAYARRAHVAYTDNGPQTAYLANLGQRGTSGYLSSAYGGAWAVEAGRKWPTAKDQAQATLPLYEAVWPGVAETALPDRAIVANWPSMPLQLGAYVCFKPGQWDFYGRIGRRQGNVLFAGSHTSQEWAGDMEGAVRSGAHAAAALLTDLGRERVDHLLGHWLGRSEDVKPRRGLQRRGKVGRVGSVVAARRRAAGSAPGARD